MIARKSWSAKRASAAQERFQAGGGDPSDPAGPVYQWAALLVLDGLEADYRQGDAGALLAAIRKCANHQLPLPEWVAREFIRRYDLVLSCRVGSWDDAFGKPLPKGKTLNAARKRREKRFAVYLAVRERRDRGQPVDEQLFADVGAELAISGSSARDLYYDVVNNWLPPLPPDTYKKPAKRL